MKVTILDTPVITSAQAQAQVNWVNNIAALKNLSALPEVDHFTWLYARDGTLTCKNAEGRWLLGNSLPRRTAERMLRELRVSQSVCCFLDVPHAAFLKVALERLSKNQAMIAVVPDAEQLSLLLHCEDLSREIGAERLWLAGGEDWPERLTQIFHDHPGLPTPNSFIRTSLSEETLLQIMIARAQEIFATETRRRSEIIAEYARGSLHVTSRSLKKICLIAPSTFRLWDPAAQTLATLVPATQFDPDEPTSASPLALAMAASDCDTVLSANIGRAEANGVVSPQRPWITWITRPMIPAYVGAKRDHLLLADPSWQAAAQSLGWGADQISVAGWPQIFEPAPAGTYLAFIADTMAVTVEPDHFDLSSHALLWETIRRQLVDDPFDLQTDPAQYLRDILQQCNVSADGLDQTAFIEQLIVPSYQQGLAKVLLQNGLPLRLFGQGWTDIAEFAPYAGGCIADIASVREVVTKSAALIHATPVRHAHPIEAMGRPVVYSAGANHITFLQQAKMAIRGNLPTPAASTCRLSADMILSRI